MIRITNLKDALGLKSFGAKGWLSNSNIDCPECGRKGKFGIRQNENGSGAVHCFFCDYTESIYKYLVRIGRKDLISYSREFNFKDDLKQIGETPDEDVKVAKTAEYPLGFKRIYNDEYLNSRGWLPHHYSEYGVGIVRGGLSRDLRGYLIFSIFQNGELLSWLARTKFSYDWHKDNIAEAKQGLTKLMPRYLNSTGTDFANILGGCDSITENTHTVILVEGIFDCINTDTVLQLRETEDVRCCFTFGNKISDNQINILRSKKSVETVILMYDEGTTKQSKTYGMKLSKYFDTYVTFNTNKDIDPGNMDVKFAVNLLKTKRNALDFYLSTISYKF